MTRMEAALTLMAELIRFLFGLAVTCVNAYVLHLALTSTFPETNKDLVIAS